MQSAAEASQGLQPAAPSRSQQQEAVGLQGQVGTESQTNPSAAQPGEISAVGPSPSVVVLYAGSLPTTQGKRQVLASALGPGWADRVNASDVYWTTTLGPQPGALSAAALVVLDNGQLGSALANTSLPELQGVLGGDLVLVGAGLALLRAGTGLRDLSCLAALRVVSGALQVIDSAVERLDGTSSLQSVGQGLVLRGNLNLESLQGLGPPVNPGQPAGVSSVQMSGPLLVQGFNYRLGGLEGVPVGSIVPGDLRLEGLFNLSSLGALGMVNQIQGTLEARGNGG